MQNSMKNFGMFVMALLLVSSVAFADSSSGSGPSAQAPIACVSIPIACPTGETSQISGYDSSGCPIYSCVSKGANQPPVINGISAPTQLSVGQTGTWAVNAYDPENGQLTYSVNWGDAASSNSPSASIAQSFGQTSTFTHSYANAGTYTITFTVEDSQGATAQSTTTVSVVAQACVSIPIACPTGATSQISGYDSSGCPIYSCTAPPTGGETVDISVSAQPQAVNLYDTFAVQSTVTWLSTSSPTSEQTFKVVTSHYHLNYIGLSGKVSHGTIMLEGVNSSDLGASISALINSYLVTAPESAPATSINAQPQQPTGVPQTSVAQVAAQPAPQAQATTPAPQEVAAQPVASVATQPNANMLGESKIDYISLLPGQSANLTAYFTTTQVGTDAVQVAVYSTDTGQLLASSSTYVTIAQAANNTTPANTTTNYISLTQGWNMVSVPVSGSVQISDIAKYCDPAYGTGAASSYQYAWQLTQNGYVKVYALVPGQGYWLKSNYNCNYPVSGDAYTGAPASLFAGWNLVGAGGSDLSMVDSTGTCKITAGPWYYSKSSGSSSGAYAYASTLSPGQAYWIKVPSACTLGSGDQPPAPPS